MRIRRVCSVVALVAATLTIGAAAPAVVAASSCAAPAPLTTPSPAPQEEGFHAIAPVRLLDTRIAGVKVGAGCTQVVDLAGIAAVPAGSTAVALNVTAVDATAAGYVTAYPCGSTRPFASNLNPRVRDDTANSVLVGIDSTRIVCLYTLTSLNLIVDVTGYFGRFGAPFHSVDDTRVLDTRTSLRPDAGTGPLAAATELRVPLAGGAVPAAARAVAINVTVTDGALPGFVTAYPCSNQIPATSTVNFLPVQQRANHAVVGLGDGAVCVWSSVEVHVIIDVEGWFGGDVGSGTLFEPLLGTRVLDTRVGTGGVTGPIVADATSSFDPSGGAALPIGSTAAISIISTEATAHGYVTLYPCGTTQPNTSAVNSTIGTESTNVAFVPVEGSGAICLYTSATMHLVVDVIGTFGPGGPLHDLSISPLTLDQPFTPDAHDYTTHCAAGANTMTVHAVAAPAAAVSVAASTVAAPSGATSTVDQTMTLDEDQAFIVRAGRPGAAAEEYWVRCLPHDFPVIDVTRNEAPNPGWYLTDDAFPVPDPSADQSRFVMILDSRSVPVWYHRVSSPSINLMRLDDGTLAWTKLLGLAFGSDPDGAYEIHALDGTLLRSVKAVGGPTDHHDLAQLPNGDVVIATYVPRQHVDLTVLGPGYGNDELVYDSDLEEIRPDGSVAWTWKSEDHIPTSATTFPQRLPGAAGVGVDLVHINSISVAPDGDLIVSSRHTDTVYKIRRDPAGDVVMRFGGTQSDVTFVNDPLGGFARQHDAQMLANGDLRVFDNRTALGPPRAVEYAINTVNHTATLVWSASNPAVTVSGGVGSVRSLGDGDTVIAWGGSANPAFTEIGPDGSQLQATTIEGHYPYRVDKQPVTAFDINTLRATAGT